MCRNPITIKNPMYRECFRHFNMDSVVYSIKQYITVPCGRCDECVRARCNDWSLRLSSEMTRSLSKGCRNMFITLTISDEYYNNQIHPRKYIRLFLDRVRKYYGHSVKHWITFEYGSNPYCTHRLHFHGILFNTKMTTRTLRRLWHYGRVHVGDYCNLRTTSYITKYIMKSATLHGNLPKYWLFTPAVMCSAGIGLSLIETRFEEVKQCLIKNLKINIGTQFSYSIPRYYLDKVCSRADKIIRRLHQICDEPDPCSFRGHHYSTPIEADDARREYNRLHSLWKVQRKLKEYIPKILPNTEEFGISYSIST